MIKWNIPKNSQDIVLMDRLEDWYQKRLQRMEAHLLSQLQQPNLRSCRRRGRGPEFNDDATTYFMFWLIHSRLVLNETRVAVHSIITILWKMARNESFVEQLYRPIKPGHSMSCATNEDVYLPLFPIHVEQVCLPSRPASHMPKANPKHSKIATFLVMR